MRQGGLGWGGREKVRGVGKGRGRGSEGGGGGLHSNVNIPNEIIDLIQF